MKMGGQEDNDKIAKSLSTRNKKEQHKEKEQERGKRKKNFLENW